MDTARRRSRKPSGQLVGEELVGGERLSMQAAGSAIYPPGQVKVGWEVFACLYHYFPAEPPRFSCQIFTV